MVETKPFSQSCENNKDPILVVLKRITKSVSTVLEVGSGTGQHAVYFAEQLPHLDWQTSDQPSYHLGIKQWLDEADLPNTRPPVELDVRNYAWGERQYDMVFTANTLHIMSHDAAAHFMCNVAKALHPTGIFVAYGPFNYAGNYTSESNAQFDAWLKQQDSRSGIRDIQFLEQCAEKGGLQLIEDNQMPANNRLLVWRKHAC